MSLRPHNTLIDQRTPLSRQRLLSIALPLSSVASVALSIISRMCPTNRDFLPRTRCSTPTVRGIPCTM